MGGVCCNNKDSTKLADINTSLKPLSQLNLRDVINEGTSIAIIGPKSVGKTLLFMRLIYPEVDVSDITSISAETETLHVELFGFVEQTIILWDISGGLMETGVLKHLDSIRIPALIYVVSMLDVNPATIIKYRTDLAQLVAHPLAVVRKLLIIFNTFGAFEEDGIGQARQNLLLRGLDIARLIEMIGRSRVNYVVGNVKEGLQDEAIRAALEALIINLYS